MSGNTASISLSGSRLGSQLTQLLVCDDIVPGAEPSYQLCKTIYLYHPLGAKIAESPISMAMSQEREVSIPDSPESMVKEAYQAEWKALQADERIHNLMTTSRVYGVATIALVVEGVPANRPIDYRTLHTLNISFNVLDPLNTSGTQVYNQDPNAFDFQKQKDGVTVSGTTYHRSRTVTMLNERPIYIAYTTSAFGYVGRSVYQRCLFPLKSFIQTMVTDDMVVRKAGVLIAVLKAAGSIVDSIMAYASGVKRNLIKEAETNNVISVNLDEKIETLNMQNLDGAYGMARKNILENTAVSADMPAQLLNSETFAEGFGEGTEDAKAVAKYIDRLRVSMALPYSFFDKIAQHRAWNPEFYKTVQAKFPEDYGQVGYTEAFYRWTNSFETKWPSLLTEPDSEKVKTDDVKLKAINEFLKTLLPEMDPENKATLIAWAQDNANNNKHMFQDPLVLDYDALRAYVPPEPVLAGESESFSGGRSDAATGRRRPQLRSAT